MSTIPSSDIPSFATDASVATGDETGLSVRLSPGTDATQGAIGGRRYAARWFNYVLGVFGDWLRYFREANGLRLTDTPRDLCIPTEGFCELVNAPSTDAAYIRLDGEAIFGSSANINQPVLSQNLTNCYFMWQLSDVLPKDGVLTEVSIQVCGSTAWTALPTTKPKLSVVYRGPDGTLLELAAAVTDPSANATAFKALHDLTISGLSLDLSTSTPLSPAGRIYLVLEGAKDTTFWSVFFAAPRAKVKSKAWV